MLTHWHQAHADRRFHFPRSSRLLIALLSIILFSYGGAALPLHAADTDADRAAQIDAVLGKFADQNAFSGSVLFAHNGDILLSKGYGLANREWDNPNTADTVFPLYTMTMQFTAMGILMLQEQGKLSLQDLICQYVDDCPAAWADIHIQQLLNHTSGLPDVDLNLPTRVSSFGVLNRFIHLPLDNPPGQGASFDYSDYLVLGAIMYKVSGQPYASFLQHSIFDPLGMTDTGFDQATQVVAHRAEIYGGINEKGPYVDMSNYGAAGGLYSTVQDLYKWDQALYSWKIVSQATWDAMLKAAVPANDSAGNQQYVDGLEISQVDGHPVIGDNGCGCTTHTSIEHLQDENFTVIVLSNFEDGEAPGISEIIVRKFFAAN